MHQHQHRNLPLEQLKSVPLPVVTLLEALLDKDPAKRPQTPADLSKAMPRIANAIDSRRKIARQGLENAPVTGGSFITIIRLLPSCLTVSERWSRNRFPWRNARKQPARNTVAKKRATQEEVDSAYLFGNACHSLPFVSRTRPQFLPTLRVSLNPLSMD
jgi:hypothetical protein